MKSAELGQILARFAEAPVIASNADASRRLSSLAGALQRAGSRTVVQSIKAASSQDPSEEDASFDRSRASLDLAGLAAVLEAAKAKAASADIMALAKLLGETPGVTPQGLAEPLRTPRKSPSAKAAKKSTRSASEIVEWARKTANELQNISLDARAFDAVVQELISDRKHTKADLDAVAKAFLGYAEVYSSKKEIAEALIRRSKMEILGDSRRKIIERTGV